MAQAKLYTIFTERKNVEGIEAILNRYLAGYTLTECTGVWRGAKEESLRIDVLIFAMDMESKYLGNAIQQICREIAVLNKQESVLLIENNVDAEMV